MGRHCSAFNCKLSQTAETSASGITFHLFPKNKEIRKKWIIALRRDQFKPSKSATLCSNHFESDCFLKSGWSSKRRVLKPDVIPTIFNFSEPPIKKVRQRKVLKNRDKPRKKKSRQKKTKLNPNIIKTIGNSDSPYKTISNVSNQPLDLTSREIQEPVAGTTNTSSTARDLDNNSADEVVIVETMMNSDNELESVTIIRDVHLNKNVQTSALDLTQSKNTNTEKLSTRTHRKTYTGDFKEADMNDSIKATRFFSIANEEIHSGKRKIKTLLQNNSRLKDKIASCEALVEHLVSRAASLLLLETLPEQETRQLLLRLTSGPRGG